MNVLRRCLDVRVLAGLALTAVAVWLIAPGPFAAVLPILIFAACPLSMLLMAWMMRGHGATPPTTSSADRLVALERERLRIEAEIARARPEVAAPVAGERARG